MAEKLGNKITYATIDFRRRTYTDGMLESVRYNFFKK